MTTSKGKLFGLCCVPATVIDAVILFLHPQSGWPLVPIMLTQAFTVWSAYNIGQMDSYNEELHAGNHEVHDRC